MTTLILTYFAIALGMLLGLARMILTIGRTLGDCPETGRRARTAAVTIATGFAAIGTGGVILIASALPTINGGTPVLLFALGLACLVLGLGFVHAVRQLRDVVQPRRAPVTAVSEPVLA